MGATIKGITIEIGGDTTKLDKAISGVNKQSRSLQVELRNVNKLLKLDPKNTELLAQKQEILKESIAATSEKLDVLKEAEAQVQEQFERGEVSEEQYRGLQREIISTEQNLKDLEIQAGKSNDVIEEAATKFEKVGKKSTELGKKAMPVSAAIAGVGTAGVGAAMEIDNAYDTIIVKTGATGDKLEGLKDAADHVFTDLPTTAEKAGIAIGEVNTRFGLVGEACEETSKDFIRFAEINDTDLNAAIDNTDRIMQKFNIDSEHSGEVLGLLTKAGQDTGISMDTLFTQLDTNGAILKEMDLGIEESVQLLAQFEKNGVDSSQALRGLQKAQQKATEEGKSLDDALAETIEAIKTSSDETEALQIATELFGRKGAAEMTQAIREGRFSLEDFTGSLEDYGTTVEDTFGATLDPWDEAKMAVNELKVAGKELGEQLMSTLKPILDKVIDKIKSFTDWFKKLNDKQKDTIVKVGLVVAALGPALVIFGKVAGAIGKVMRVMKLLKPVIATVKAGFVALKAVMLANPFGLIVAAIAAVIAIFVTLYKKCEWFRDAVDAIWVAIKEAFFTVWDAVKNFFTETLPNAIQSAIKWFKRLWDGIVSIFQGIGQWFGDRFTEAWNFIVSIFQGIGQWFQERYNEVTAAFQAIGQWFNQKFTEAWNFITGIFQAIGQWFVDRYNDVTGAFSAIGTWFSTKFTEAYNNVTAAFSAIGSWFQGKYNAVTSVFSGIGSWFHTKFTEAYNNIKSAFSGIGAFFSGIWTTIKSKFTTIGTNIGNAIGGAFKTAMNSALATVEGAINKGIGFINGAIGVINKLPGVSIGTIGTVSLPRLAKGGTLKEGQAIVAEAGPELIQIVNGEAIVTPLTGTAANTRVDHNKKGKVAAAGGVTFNQQNVFNSPKALSATEISRKNRTATRSMVLQLARG